MAERKYTVGELDLMRQAIEVLGGTSPQVTEERLRTYMANGTEPEELTSLAHAKWQSLKWAADPAPVSPFAPVADE